jgi:alkanesulfonate monooxygenase SsuD/methylene tetrahydromethanopterin reductase-like flavin-dependent oxidoreductase (luciferase family)
MSYPYLPKDFDEKYESGWVTVPNELWDAERARGLYRQYIDQLVYASEIGFDGMVLNEHHQNIYGLMPSPNIIAAALAHATKRGKIVVLGNLLPLHINPLRVAEEYAMLDNMSDGRIVAGFAPGSGPETFNYDIPSAPTREQFWEAVDLIRSAWTKHGPFAYEGKHYPLRYVNPWPQPTQKPHPPIWIPAGRSKGTLREIAKHGYSYFLSSRSHGAATAKSQQLFASTLAEYGQQYEPHRMGILMSVCVGETDAEAQENAKEGIWYFLRNCLKGHQRREGRQLTYGPGVPYIPSSEWADFVKFTDPTTPLLGDTEDWDDLQRSQSILVGSPETVYRRLMDILEQAPVGNLLLQFHLGNMPDAWTRKSMHLFATQVLPRLREDTAKLFGRQFPHMNEAPVAEVAR